MLAPDRTRTPRRAASPTRTASCCYAVLTALAFVTSSLFGLIHEATTRHVRCAQHGELIDGDAAIADATAATFDAERPGATTRSPDLGYSSIERGGSTIAVHGHQHCSLVSATRELRAMPRPPAIVPAVVAIADLAIAPRAVAPRAGVVYRTAPKTSPPA